MVIVVVTMMTAFAILIDSRLGTIAANVTGLATVVARAAVRIGRI